MQLASSVQTMMKQKRSEIGRQLFDEYQKCVNAILAKYRIAENKIQTTMAEITIRIGKLEAALLEERRNHHECVLQAEMLLVGSHDGAILVVVFAHAHPLPFQTIAIRRRNASTGRSLAPRRSGDIVGGSVAVAGARDGRPV